MARLRMKSIARIDQERRFKTTKGKWSTRNTRGWYVQVAWKGKRYTRFFSDGKLGGKEKARRAAIEWRDSVEERVGKPQTDAPVVWREPSKGAGVSLTVKEGAPVYQVSWVDGNGRHGRTSVSIRKWGKREALRRARELREKLHVSAFAF